MPDEKKYRRLRSGSGASLVSRHTLWIGEDHLLSITNTFGTEAYRRYYFGEIQALVSHRTSSWLVGNLIFSFVALCVLVPAAVLLGKGDGGASIALFVVGGIVVVMLLINLIAGPTAKVFIQTATSYDPIPGVTRWFMIRRIIRRIEPLIREAQHGRAARAVAAQSVVPQAEAAPSA